MIRSMMEHGCSEVTYSLLFKIITGFLSYNLLCYVSNHFQFVVYYRFYSIFSHLSFQQTVIILTIIIHIFRHSLRYFPAQHTLPQRGVACTPTLVEAPTSIWTERRVLLTNNTASQLRKYLFGNYYFLWKIIFKSFLSRSAYFLYSCVFFMVFNVLGV